MSHIFQTVDIFKFHDHFALEDNKNGQFLDNFYVPVEVLVHILSYVDSKEILSLCLVCKKWCNMIKSELLWYIKYTRNYHKNPKKLPWYVYYCLFSTHYFDTNLLKNGNGQDKFKYWELVQNYGRGFDIEIEPIGCNPLPTGVPEFNGYSSCFVTSYHACQKLQRICVKNNRLMLYILNKFKPHIYASEWITGRFEYASNYILWCKLLGKSKNKHKPLILLEEGTSRIIDPWPMLSWTKVEVVLKNYPEGIEEIVFEHLGFCETDMGHNGSKMTGGVVKILFDSIEPINF